MSDQNQDRLSEESLQRMPSFYNAKSIAYRSSSRRRSKAKNSRFPERDTSMAQLCGPLTDENLVDNLEKSMSSSILKTSGPVGIKACDGRQLLLMLSDNWLNFFL